MKKVSLVVDGKNIQAPVGQKVLWAALDNDIYIPNLCAIREAQQPYAGCRLCFVEIEGCSSPVTACTQEIAEGMMVNTKGKNARRLARTSLELLLASHPVDCARCPSNRACELQKIAAFLGVRLNTKRFRRILRNLPVDSSCELMRYDPNLCVLCGKCVWHCRNRLGVGVLGFARRGFNRVVTTFEDRPLAETQCEKCLDCAAVCPVGAFTTKKDGELVRISR